MEAPPLPSSVQVYDNELFSGSVLTIPGPNSSGGHTSSGGTAVVDHKTVMRPSSADTTICTTRLQDVLEIMRACGREFIGWPSQLPRGRGHFGIPATPRCECRNIVGRVLVFSKRLGGHSSACTKGATRNICAGARPLFGPRSRWLVRQSRRLSNCRSGLSRLDPCQYYIDHDILHAHVSNERGECVIRRTFCFVKQQQWWYRLSHSVQHCFILEITDSEKSLLGRWVLIERTCAHSMSLGRQTISHLCFSVRLDKIWELREKFTEIWPWFSPADSQWKHSMANYTECRILPREYHDWSKSKPRLMCLRPSRVHWMHSSTRIEWNGNIQYPLVRGREG